MNQEKSYWIRSGALTLMERFATQFLALISVMLLFRALTKAEVGQWATFLAIVTIVEVGRTGLLQNALVRFLSTAESTTYRQIATASFVLNLLITIPLAALIYGLSDTLSEVVRAPQIAILFKWYALTTIALIPFLQFNFMQQANLEFRGIFWSAVVRQSLYFLYIAIFFGLDWDISLTALVIVRTVGIVLGTVVTYFFAKPFLQFAQQVDWSWVKQLFNYGKYVMGTNLSTMFYKSIDRIMIARFLGEVPVGIYDAAIKVTNLAEAPTFSMASILFPQSARRLSEGKAAIKQLYEKAVGAILAILLPALLFVLVFAEWIIWVVAGEAYLEASNILRVTMFYGLFIPYAVQFGTVLDSTGRPRINFIFTLASALLNVVFNYLFIVQYGAIGAAYGTLTTYAIAFIAMQIYLGRTFGITAFRPFYYSFYFYRKMWTAIRSGDFRQHFRR
ncbi:MAG: flippase [Bacteroidota bacterium]